jgi:hypothetical protein
MLRPEDDDYSGYVTAAGDVVVLGALDGKELFKAKLDPAKMGKHLEKVNEALLFADRDRFFVMLNRPHEGANNRGGYNPVFAQAIRSVRVNGVLYGFDRTTGRRLWHTDEQMEDQYVALEQFADLPVIIAANQYQKFAANGNFEGMFMKFVGLDKATGKLVYAKQGAGQGQQYYSMVTDPKAGTIEVISNTGQRVRFAPDDGKSVGAAEGPKDGLTTAPVVPRAVAVPMLKK